MHRCYPSLMLVLLTVTPNLATASDSPIELPSTEQFSSEVVEEQIRFSMWDSIECPHINWAAQVTLQTCPPGSSYTKFDGLESLIVGQTKSQLMKLAYKHSERIPADDCGHAAFSRFGQPILDPWWMRQWFYSLPEEKGGAPRNPFVHVIGEKITWHMGPISFTNTLHLKIDYIGSVNIDSDPDPQLAGKVKTTAPAKPETEKIQVHVADNSLDVASSVRVKVNVRPIIQINVPGRNDSWVDVLRKLAVQAEADLFVLGRKLITGRLELRYSSDQSLSLVFGFRLLGW